ncbi:hypothetical protein FGO68_gene2272 [Halteria grandinella]|uniref:Uncharacterized protein n=1 Tax=Halteria grandinella TaxID=5974 RepID=A0A8J8P2M7_HALGN|nr:hypothetical protein FGO68_gene2272 [Halteria grandinella]
MRNKDLLTKLNEDSSSSEEEDEDDIDDEIDDDTDDDEVDIGATQTKTLNKPKASCIGKLFFTWVYHIIALGKKQQLHIDDLGELDEDLRVEKSINRLKQTWKHYKLQAGQSKYALLKTIFVAFKSDYLMIIAINLLCTSLNLMSPFLINMIIRFIETKDEPNGPPLSEGFQYVGMLVISQGLYYLINEQLYFYQYQIGVKTQNAMIGMIYQKQLRISNATNKNFSQGEIINFVQVDALKIMSSSEGLCGFTRYPLIFIGCFIYLFRMIGVSFLAGLAVFAIAFIINIFLTRCSSRLQKKFMECQDDRVKLITESLNNIKMLKLYSWTDTFLNAIRTKRESELNVYWWRQNIGMINIASYYFFPQILSSVVFSVYISLGHTLDLNLAFTVMTCFTLLKEPMRTFPYYIGQFIELIISCKRIQDFFMCKTIDQSILSVTDREESKQALQINNATFNWGHKEGDTSKIALEGINLKIKHCEFVCVIGDVGSGKSSLLSAIIGDMLGDDNLQVQEGDEPIQISGKVAYVQQNPWIQNRSIRDNIVFGQVFEEQRYAETIRICQLERDLEILPAGDMTEIGEKGINLSGGQKARISLARAAYADRDIILMDDPISALDANVKKKIFKDVFIEKFSNKTRVLVTHAVDFLKYVDTIILIKEIMEIHHVAKSDENGAEAEITEHKQADIIEQSDKSILKIANFSLPNLTTKLNDSGKMMEDENLEISTVGWPVYRDYLKYLGGWRFLLFGQLSMCGYTAFKILNDYQVGNWATSEDQTTNFLYYGGLTFLYAFLTSLCIYFRAMTMQLSSWYANKQLHEDMISKVMHAPINLYFDVTPIGRILNRFSKDLSGIELRFSWELGDIHALSYLTLTSIIFVLPVIVYLGYKLYKEVISSMREVTRLESLTKSPLLSFLGETFQGASTIRTFNREKEFISENNLQLNKNILANRYLQAIDTWFALRVDLMTIAVQAASSIFCILYSGSENKVFPVMLLTYMLLFQEYFLETIRCWIVVEKRMVNVDRCMKMRDVPQEKLQGKKKEMKKVKKMKEWPETGEIQYKFVNLRYRPNTETILKDLTFQVKAGEKIGVVGRTGAGKSTICLSLSRIVEIEGGEINIDGVDISKLPIKDVRRKITVIPQDATMFTGTLKYNLDPEGKVSESRIIEVLRAAELDDLLQRDNQNLGLDMLITENGANLSSGEKQLICICRAILRKSKIVVLDEATANIDVMLEQKLQNLIQKEFQNATMITIAHRLNTIINSDRVLVLSFGEVVEYDSPANLLQNKSSEFSMLVQEMRKEQQNPGPSNQ